MELSEGQTGFGYCLLHVLIEVFLNLLPVNFSLSIFPRMSINPLKRQRFAFQEGYAEIVLIPGQAYGW